MKDFHRTESYSKIEVVGRPTVGHSAMGSWEGKRFGTTTESANCLCILYTWREQTAR
jgi:hypothetical protein